MNKRVNQIFRFEWVWIILIAVFTAISSEIKLSPFSGENFRFGMGSIVFFLMLLIRMPKRYILTGIVTACIVVGFRICFPLEQLPSITIYDRFIEHYPAGAYYFVYVIGFHFLKLKNFIGQPLKLGFLATFLEILSNSIEHLLRILTTDGLTSSLQDWLLLAAVAVLRSFFVVGLYSSVLLSEQKKRLEDEFAVGSGLYIETLYLQKSMNHIEQIMADSYDLYRVLKKSEQREFSQKVLHISQEIHEVKKDSQRIYSGLSAITQSRDYTHYDLSEVIEVAIEGNRKYAQHLEKEITIYTTVNVNFIVKEQMLFLAIINNVLANAIEAIKKKGSISFIINELNDSIYIQVRDSGKGISEEDLQLIYEPGFTTKFNDKGVAATGIGLSHVQEAIRLLEGELRVQSVIGKGTTFTIKIPRSKIEQRGE